jgi:hypothetical protein
VSEGGGTGDEFVDRRSLGPTGLEVLFPANVDTIILTDDTVIPTETLPFISAIF